MNAELRIDPRRSVLVVVDMQPDFMPGGALPVEEGDRIIEPIAKLMDAERFGLCVATQDWHHPDHISFASRHEGKKPYDRIELYRHEQILWPDHCVQGTRGAELHPDLPWDRLTAIIRKATDPLVDSYSAFRSNWNPEGERPPTGLTGYLRERGIEQVFLCGLARDFCVNWSAEDAAAAGFEVYVLWELTRSVQPSTDRDVRRNLERRGIHVVAAEQLTLSR